MFHGVGASGISYTNVRAESCKPLCWCFCQVAQIVKREMETAVKLYVKLKAKVKVGPSWGDLEDLDI